MKNLDQIPEEQRKHFLKCPEWGEYFDMRDLAQAFEHFHNKEGLQNIRDVTTLSRINPEWANSAEVGSPEEFLNGKVRVNRN